MPAPDDPGLAERDRRQRVLYLLTIIFIYVNAAVLIASIRTPPEPYHTSALRGREWVQELLDGHDLRMKEQLGVHKYVFHRLARELHLRGGLDHTRYVDIEEQIAIFLYSAVTNMSNRKVAERFQRSGDTISRCFHRVLNAIVSEGFRSAYLKLPDGDAPLADKIRSDPKFYPFFKDAIGAIDGSHIPVHPPADIRARYRDRDGNLTQNVLAACNFYMFFIYILSGWEGSISDSYLYERARSLDLRVPAGKYYLADAGFAGCDTLLVPYRGIRYHLREWGAANQRPVNKEELFNLRHSQLRNIIERIFGVAKRKFKMIAEANEYAIELQGTIAVALCVLFNFILLHDPDDYDNDLAEELRRASQGPIPNHENEEEEELGGGISRAESARAAVFRDEIAVAMWASYQDELARREA